MDSFGGVDSGVYMSAEELTEEIEFQKIVLGSIDDKTPNKEQAEVEVRAEIRRLERQLRALKHEKHTRHDTPTFGASSSRSHVAAEGAFVDDPFRPFETLAPSSTSSTPDSATSINAETNAANALTPSRLNLVSRKRPGSDLETHENKSRRASPVPRTDVSTPSTTISDDEARETRFRQLQQERARALRQQNDDEKLARLLQTEFGGGFPPHVTSTSSQPSGSQSAFERMLGRPNHDVARNVPRPIELSTLQNPIPEESTYDGQGGSPVIGQAALVPDLAQASHVAMPDGPRYTMPGAFDDSDDSDIELISSDVFASISNQRGTRNHLNQHGTNKHQPRTDAYGSASEFGMLSGTSLYSSPYIKGAYGNPGSGLPAASRLTPQEAARQAVLQRLQNISASKNDGVAAIPSMYNDPRLDAPGRPGYLQNGAAPSPFGTSQSVYGGSPTVYGSSFGSFAGLGQPGPSSSGFAAQDPLSRIIARTNTYDLDNMTDMDGNPLDRRMAMDVHDYINDPRKSEQEIKDLLENIRPDVEIPKEDREGTPEGLKYALYEHQKLALTWLKAAEDGKNRGGILADDMGLGKTISALALMLSHPSTERTCKTTLIVGPVALIRQWEREIRTKIKTSHRLSTFIYHSTHKAPWHTLREYDVVLTTYGTLGAEYKRLEIWDERNRGNQNIDSINKAKLFPFLHEKHKFYRVILDEAQCVKNRKSQAAKGAAHLHATYRFCLTGTPMMNSISELQSLIYFLRITPYNASQRFTEDFGCLSKGVNVAEYTRKRAMKRLQVVLKSIMIRRTKTSLIDGQPILTLPPKTEEIVHVLFNEDEQSYYTALETKSLLQFNKYVKAGTIGKNYSNILILLLRLRQAACHPHLIMDFDEAPSEITTDDMKVVALSLKPDVIARILAAEIPFECPVCYDPIPNPRIVTPCGHDICSECLVRITATSEQDNLAGGNESRVTKCPTCREKVEAAKVIDYETFKRVHMSKDGEVLPEGANAVGDESTDSDSDTDSESDDSDTESDDDDGEDLADFVVPDDFVEEDDNEVKINVGEDDEVKSREEEDDDDDDDDDLDAPISKRNKLSSLSSTNANTAQKVSKLERASDADQVKDEDDDDYLPDLEEIKSSNRIRTRSKVSSRQSVIHNFLADGPSNDKKNKKSKRSKQHKKKRNVKGKAKDKGKGKAREKPKHISLAMLKRDAMKNAANRRRYMRYLKDNFVSSAKTDKCVEILRNTDPSVKTIVFSQFTTLLDLIEVPVRGEFGRCYVRYDGSMSAEARNDAVVAFTDDPQYRVMLVSLKAGNAGLNLVAASQVIILDPFWNPYIEMQAVDRAHRIGQQKPVLVHRILVKATVEDRIMELQEKKRRLVDAALDEDASRGLGRLGREELIFLFSGRGDERVTAARPGAARPYGDSPSP